MTDIISTLRQSRENDKAIWSNEKAPFKAKWQAMANANGRKFIIGTITGAMRTVGGVVGVPFGLVGAAFCLVGAVFTLPLAYTKGGKGAGAGMQAIPLALCLEGAKKCGQFTLDKVKSIGRGVVEIIPFTGYALAKYDLKHSLAEKYKIGPQPPQSSKKVAKVASSSAAIRGPTDAYVDSRVSPELKDQFGNRQNIALIKPNHKSHAERLTLFHDSGHADFLNKFCLRKDTVLILDCSAYDEINHDFVYNFFDQGRLIERMGERVILWKSGQDITEQVNKLLKN